MHTAYLALGANLGNRLENLGFAVSQLEASGVVVAAQSKVYEAQSVGTGGEGDFFNAALRIQTDLDALALLQLCQSIETRAGREMTQAGVHRSGARALDIDILMFGDEQSATPELELPHPRALWRNFVLRPLLDVLEGGWLRETTERF
jgi:2-amino-4-hydroxy-6-hydroxymethyldihydropteridine diphosphokinase